ncbi:hypothetical protein F4782DRAFT_492095 [Xylaria castorea]|nr:hypothetical protein F4782DRAFT_492095 [Xylaria castorea]
MSGLELLGVVASTAQLIAYVITVSSKLNEIRCKIRNAPKKLEQYDRQFKELIAIAKQMEENPPIQTKELDLCLTTIFAKTEAIKGILTNFEQSSKSRRRWNIMSGDLSRQLDECFGDVKNTMGNLVVLITSQNAYDQKELKELVLGYTKIATASTQISTTATPLSYSTESTLNLIEYERRKGALLFDLC